jgi:hypothetical protein
MCNCTFYTAYRSVIFSYLYSFLYGYQNISLVSNVCSDLDSAEADVIFGVCSTYLA